MSEQDAVAVGVFAVAIGVCVLFVLVINAIVCVFLHKLYKALPEQHRQLSPGLVWLLMIPLFNIVWNFFVFPKLSRSYQTCFEAAGDTSAGTCNSGLALAYPILCACTIVPIPCVAPIVGLAGLVVLIVYLVKMFDLKSRIEPSAPTA